MAKRIKAKGKNAEIVENVKMGCRVLLRPNMMEQDKKKVKSKKACRGKVDY